ncbi:hypothetical protein Airi01_015390 [Actinoallomurus iriomotensis]|uniref:DUF4282 domain-containing protein n=2 Tax=Actinoallomurus iriomotensis TaxID=478107 RepID=A0A9W6RFU7_9ACTN|nr:hypothetical protein Airi01_015390 [Actinoallomurus iriomotensis]
MSNPHDDPGHRPPPPRQGEPQPSYPGGPPPPYQTDPHAYPGPPQQPGGPWQGPPPGHGMPPQPQAHAPRERAGNGFFKALFDLNFDHMVTASLIKFSYALAIVVYSLIALVMLLFAWSFSVWNKPLALATLVATPIVWVAGLLTTRMVLEFVINQFKITEHLKAMRDREGLR